MPNLHAAALGVLAVALLVIGCGGGSEEATTTTRPPITTTLPPSTTTTSTAGPATSSTTAATGPSTTEALPDSVGTVEDPVVAIVPTGVTRYFYAGADAATSVRQNALGAAQVLYYDVYPPTGTAIDLTALYLHDGGLDAGYANSSESETACRQLAALGAWCVAVEFRRGFAGFLELPEQATEISAAQASRYRKAFQDARNDALEAWFHADQQAATIGLPTRYVIAGTGGGARIASDISLATPGLPYEIAGAIVASGTHDAGRPLAGVPTFPVVLQNGLFDEVAPAYIGNVYLDADMPITIGAVTLYGQLVEAGAAVKLHLNAQGGHGLQDYRAPSGEVILFAEAIELFTGGAPEAGLAEIEYRFSCADANFGAAAPGISISTAQFEDFRYEPYQSDLESGLTPAESVEVHPLELTDCEG